MHRLLLVIVVLIAYVSLFPFHFDRPAIDSPLWILLHSWPSRFARGDLRDGASNVLLYVPLGYVAVQVFRRRWWLALAIGTALSAAIEMAQIYDETRYCSLFDVLSNTLGIALGVAAGLVLPSLNVSWAGLRRWKTGVAAVATCWAAYQLYPFVPMLARGQWLTNAVKLWHPPLSPVEAFVVAAEWFAFAVILETVMGRLTTGGFAVALLALPMRLFIVDRALDPAELVGGALALVLWTVAGRRRADLAIFLLAAAILMRELSPFRFSEEAQRFSWVPFMATIESDRLPSVTVILRKAFDYGAMVWLLRGIGIVRAGFVVAAALMVLEWTQRWLPGRSPEITDPLIALLMMLPLLWEPQR